MCLTLPLTPSCTRRNTHIHIHPDLRLHAAAGASPPATAQQQDKEEKEEEAGSSGDGDMATDAQLDALRARLRLFAARAMADWGLALERRRLRWALARWALWAFEKGAAASCTARGGGLV
jgi:hypothetical protein